MRNLLPHKGTSTSIWIKAAICASAMACFSLTPAFAQCTLNGSSDPTCSLPDGTTINTYTDTSGSSNITTTAGTLTNNGTMTIFGGVELVNATSLVGPGTLTLASGQIGTNGNNLTLTNASIIAGSGIVGSNGLTNQNLNLANTGTINANSNGSTLSLQGNGGSIINSGTFEATGGGILSLATQAAINNNGGNIASTGANSLVSVNTTIQGGTLNTSAGGVMQTAAGGATLDASSQGAITLSDGSTYAAGTAGSGTITNITGTLNLGTTSGSTLALGGALRLVGDTTVNPATSGGSITMNSGQIGTDGNVRTLTNNALIQGSGIIGSNNTTNGNLNLINAGTINANAVGTLSIQGNGSSIVNTGTLEATAGGSLNLATQAAINNNGGNITSAGTGSIVSVNTTIQGGTLNTSAGGVMQTATGGATLDALNQGAITLSDGSTYAAGAAGTGTVTNITGTLNLGTTSGSTLALGGALRLVGDTTVNPATSGGSITMTSGQIGTDGNVRTLTNNVLIQGSGIIGSDNTTNGNLNLANNGTINANSSGNTLSITGNGASVINAGTFEATNGGTLNVNTVATVNNQNGTILAATGSTVNLTGTIQGGTLTTQNTGLMQTSGSVTLDAATLGAITLTDGSTYTAGAAGSATVTSIIGTLNLGATSGSTLALGGALRLVGDTTVNPATSGSSITMTNGQIGTNGNVFTLTNDVLIQGSGIIGSDNTTFGNLNLANNGTINANSSGNTLSITGNGASVINAGTFEATNGGTLNVNTVAAVNNQNGTILAAIGSTVNLSGTIRGGTLTTQGTGVMQTSSSVTLDAATLGAITLTDGSTYTAGAGMLTNITGQLNLGTVTGSTLQSNGTNANVGYLRLVGDTTFAGPGSVVLNGGLIGTDGNVRTLTNNSVIQGAGVIGSNTGSDFQNLSLNNTGTINANSSGNTLSIQGTGPVIANTGLIEATSGGTLNLATSSAIDNQHGNITAADLSTVNVNTTIQGGTLNTSGTGLMQTSGVGATLDGNTNGAITISDGSIYTAGNGPLTNIVGTLNLGTVTGGELALSGQMRLVGNTTFSGPGTVLMSGNAQIGTNGNAYLLTNNSTIQGNGLVGSNAGALNSNGSVTNNGSIISNGGTLTVANTGGLTNNGTMQANAGSTLLATSGFTNFSGNTLTGGTYNAFGGGTAGTAGTIQINALGTGGGEIVNNAATILLSGSNSNFFDTSGDDALSKLASNSGSLSILNGRNLTTPGAFSNTGTVDIGSTDDFSVNGGSSNYTQTGGIAGTQLDGIMTVNTAAIDGGFLEGIGTVAGNLKSTTGGSVDPGDGDANGDATGTLTVDSIYVQTSTGNLVIALASLSAYDVLDITGSAASSINGTLTLDAIDGFTLAAGDTFFFIDYNNLTGTFSTVNTSGLNLAPGLTASINYDFVPVQPSGVPESDPEVELIISGTTSATPEPSTWFLFAGGFGALAAFQLLRKRRAALQAKG